MVEGDHGLVCTWGLRNLNDTLDVIFSVVGVVVIITSEWAKLHYTRLLRNGFNLIWNI